MLGLCVGERVGGETCHFSIVIGQVIGERPRHPIVFTMSKLTYSYESVLWGRGCGQLRGSRLLGGGGRERRQLKAHSRLVFLSM